MNDTNLPFLNSLTTSFDGDGPRYQQLARHIKQSIKEGLISTGSNIPSERELAERLDVSRVTVRKAIESLVHEGLLEVRHGSGTFVSARVEQPLSVLASFSQDMAQRNCTPGSIWISRVIGHPNHAESIALGLMSTEQVARLSRVRTANNVPMAIERATINAAFIGGNAKFGDSLYEALKEHDCLPVRALQTMRADIATDEEARLLHIPSGSAVLRTERRSYSSEGKPIELTNSVYRGDRYDYLVELRTLPTPPTNM
ncbi:GntR family transcriptional regulator [Undibacterium sp. Ji67W]|uniref:GntR family transcriptional regulator n=1 Tax=Undibacterium sp. Ji67W TaxID=3413042 RepID=UPI003BF30BE1